MALTRGVRARGGNGRRAGGRCVRPQQFGQFRKETAAARVERLECRLLLAAVSWDGGGDGTNWNNALNWATDQVPTAADDVTIAIAGSPTIQITDVRSVKSLTADESINLSGGTLTL